MAYLEKAAREAKEHTSWTHRNADYDEALSEFVAGVYADESLIAEVEAFARRVTPYGWSNSLAAKLVQLTMPGVPDLYQGSELWDLSLVDPDNRRPVDYDLRRDLLANLDGGGVPDVDDTGRAKLHVVTQALHARRELPGAFDGPYGALAAAGPAADHTLAFGRGDAVITVATRLPVTLERQGGWRDTTLALPAGDWFDRLTGERYSRVASLSVLLDRLPVALLQRHGN